jgi:hypothetical protein
MPSVDERSYMLDSILYRPLMNEGTCWTASFTVRRWTRINADQHLHAFSLGRAHMQDGIVDRSFALEVHVVYATLQTGPLVVSSPTSRVK